MTQEEITSHMEINKTIIKAVTEILEEKITKHNNSEPLLFAYDDNAIDYLLKCDERINTIFQKLGKSCDDPEGRYKRYEEALKTSTGGYSVILKRYPCDAFVNNYNPEWIYAWDGNMDLQICLHPQLTPLNIFTHLS